MKYIYLITQDGSPSCSFKKKKRAVYFIAKRRDPKAPINMSKSDWQIKKVHFNK